MIRTLLWSPKGSGLHYGGPGMSAYRLYRRADPQRLQVSLAHGVADHPDGDAFVAQHRVFPLIRTGAKKPPSALDQLRFVRAGKAWVRQHARDFDVFHGLQGFDLTVQVAAEAQRLGLPSVIKLAAHRSDLADKAGFIKKLLGRPARRRAAVRQLSGVIAISNAIADELLEYGIPESKIARIPNGVDTQRFHPVTSEADRVALREQLGYPEPQRPAILFSGGLNGRKRPHLLIQAVALLLDANIDATLVLLGPPGLPEYVDQLSQTADDLQVGDRIYAPGFAKDPAQHYRAANAFCLPSSSEGMPNALLEAMATGVPCLGTRISGITDLLDHENTGLLVEPNPDDIAHHLATALSPTGQALGQAARAIIEQRYSVEAVLQKHEQLFESIRT
ncbi:MAG: glycosyltransferase family 4 protein [Planctomycetota bacterium]